jgi:PAS domain S-box-containing protein
MDVSHRAVRNIIDAAEASSLPVDEILFGLGLEEALIARKRIRWDVLVTILNRIFECLGQDCERMRDLGAAMVRTPSFDHLQVLARSLLSVRMLHEIGTKWMAPAFFPHMPLSVEFPAEGRVVFRGSIPDRYTGCAPFFWLFEGCMREIPRLLGLPPAVLEQSTVTSHTLETQFAYTSSKSLPEQAVKVLRAAFSIPRAIRELERHRGEFETGLEAMRRGTDELMGVLDQLPDLLVIHRDGSILWGNRALIEVFGFDGQDEVVGKPLLSLFDETSVPVARARLLGPSGEVVPALEVQARRRDGALLTLELTRPQVVLFGGAPAGLAVARDVGERVRMQRQLIVSDRLASLGVLAAGVAHEINNPLACALGGLEVANMELAGRETPRLCEALEVMGEGMDRVRTIVRDLRTLGQSDDAQVIAVDVNAALESTITLVAKTLARRARVERDYRSVPHARANPARLGQVLLNLVLNAIDAIPVGAPGDNIIRIETSRDAEGRVVIEISDSGPGIPSDVLGRMFDPFFTTKPVGQGTGLGLAICHRIVTELGGKISVDSALGVGTTLRVALPAVDTITKSPDDMEREKGIAAKKLRVLLVDDEQRILKILRMVLMRHHVTTATNVDEALARIAQEPAFDVVVSDVMMPGRSGVDFFAALQKLEPELCDRFLFITAGALGSDTTLEIARTKRPCLDKPFNGKELQVAIEAILRDARPRAVPSHSIVAPAPARDEATTTQTNEDDGKEGLRHSG